MYSLHDCLYPEGKVPIEKLCYWKKRQTVDTCPVPVSDVKVAKASTLMKKHNFRNRENGSEGLKKERSTEKKTRGKYKDKIDLDPRVDSDRDGISTEKLKEIKATLVELNCLAGLFHRQR